MDKDFKYMYLPNTHSIERKKKSNQSQQLKPIQTSLRERDTEQNLPVHLPREQ